MRRLKIPALFDPLGPVTWIEWVVMFLAVLLLMVVR